MPRGSRPGERRGGRQRGTLNRKTVLRNAAINAAALHPNLSPLDFLLGLMRDSNLSQDLRVKAAQSALPLVHSKTKDGYAGPPAPRRYWAEPANVNNADKDTNSDGHNAATLGGPTEVLTDVGGTNLSPLDFLLGVMRDTSAPAQLRLKVAHVVAPFVHPKLADGRLAESEVPIDDPYGFVVDRAFARELRDDYLHMKNLVLERYKRSWDVQVEREAEARFREKSKRLNCPSSGYTALQAREDEKRIHTLYKKRITHPYKLTEEEDAEEAHRVARHAAYRVGPEAEARSRIVVLGLSCWKNRGSAAEQSELDELKARYPDLPIDPDDVHLIRTLKAYDEALKRYREMSTESGQGLKRRQGER
jgi:hypothetical protein